MAAHDPPDRALDGVDIGAAVDYLDALRLGGGQGVVGTPAGAVEFDGFVIQAGFAVRRGGVAGAGASQAGFGIDVDEQSEIGLEAAAGDAFERGDGVGAKVAPAALDRKSTRLNSSHLV